MKYVILLEFEPFLKVWMNGSFCFINSKSSILEFPAIKSFGIDFSSFAIEKTNDIRSTRKKYLKYILSFYAKLQGMSHIRLKIYHIIMLCLYYTISLLQLCKVTNIKHFQLQFWALPVLLKSGYSSYVNVCKQWENKE